MIVDPVSPIYVLIVFLPALAVSRFLSRRGISFRSPRRFAAIDGLRGYLAMGVFVHHACIWYFYLREGVWRLPPSSFYANIGQASVVMFFMITSFLFSTKLMDEKPGSFGWARFFVGRLMRLGPLYLFSIALLVVLVFLASGGTLRESPRDLCVGLLSWLAFTIPGSPDLNGLSNTGLILAHVTWTLPYEWLFYLSLPLVSLCLGKGAPWLLLVFSSCALNLFVAHGVSWPFLLAFAFGACAALVIRSSALRAFAKTGFSSICVVVLLVISLFCFATSYEPIPMLILAISFTLIAAGSSVFGGLDCALSRYLGEVTYSIYLLHGLLLFILFKLLPLSSWAATLPAFVHWLLVATVSPLLVIVSGCTYMLIEEPAIRSTDRALQVLRGGLAGLAKPLSHRDGSRER